MKVSLREFSLKKIDKLLKSRDYHLLRTSGKKIENNEFILIYRLSVLKNSRLGITVSKKIGCAVKRNRIKRIIREFYRKNRSLIKKPLDVNVIAKKSVSGSSSENLFYSLKEVFAKIDT